MICNNCWKETKEEDEFCSNCGVKLREHAETLQTEEIIKKKKPNKILFIVASFLVIVLAIFFVKNSLDKASNQEILLTVEGFSSNIAKLNSKELEAYITPEKRDSLSKNNFLIEYFGGVFSSLFRLDLVSEINGSEIVMKQKNKAIVSGKFKITSENLSVAYEKDIKFELIKTDGKWLIEEMY